MIFLLAAASALSCVAIDGDTIKCGTGYALHVRLTGIDAPEIPGHCRPGRNCAPGDPYASKAKMAAMVTGKRVYLYRLGKDKYGRTIADVTVNRKDLSCEQLRGGFAIYVQKWDNKLRIHGKCPALSPLAGYVGERG